MATKKQGQATRTHDEVAYDDGGVDVREASKIRATQVKVQVKSYKGRKFVDVRWYYQGEDGEWFPTKKGITVSSRTGAEKLAEYIVKASAKL